MNTVFKSALLAGIVLASAPQMALAKKAKDAAAEAAPATSANGFRVQGLGVADLDAVVANADANRTAAQQRPVTYKAQIDAYQARGQQIQTQLKPLVEKFQRDQAAPNANQQALATQANTIQQIQENAQRELNEIIKPVAYSEAYVTEQIEEKIDQAVKNAMTANKVTILIRPDMILASENSYNLSPAILAEVNKLIPNAQLVPPQGWEPRQLREARAQAAAQQQGQKPAAAAPAVPAGPAVDGR